MQDTINIPKELMKPLENYTTQEVHDFMKMMMEASLELFKEKDKDYDGSWQKRGILSAQSNFERKNDRIIAQFYNGTMFQETGENIGDTFIDAGNYAFMYIFFLYKKNPMVKKHLDDFIFKYHPKGEADILNNKPNISDFL